MSFYKKEILLKTSTEIINSGSHFISKVKPSEWAEKNRVMSSEVSPFPGKFSYDKTPYLKEVADCFSPGHLARVVAVMKGVQLGFSTGVLECVIGWIIAHNPGNILYLTGDKELSKEAMEMKIDQMIDSSGLRHLIGPNTVRKRNQRTGDTSSSKEFPGGRLIAGSMQNANKLRQRSMRFGLIDDFDAAPSSDKSAGSITSLIETRFKAYHSIMKLLYISSPESKEKSNIEAVFKLGDQRYYNVPCPLCHEMIPLHWRVSRDNGDVAGIYYETDSGGNLIPKSVGYICQKCGGFFKEKHKYEMNANGLWVPTATASEIGYYSYHLSALYAPAGMADWTHYAQQWVKIHPSDGPVKKHSLRTFLNTVLGQSWQDEGNSPRINELMRNTRGYKIGTIPSLLSKKDGNGNIVLLTCACDLNGTIDDARLDYEIVAWAESGSSYSIDHGSIGTFSSTRGKKEDEREKFTYRNEESNSVWITLHEVISKIYETDEDRKMKIMFTGIDTGQYQHYAFTFIDNYRQGLVYGIKGGNELTIRKTGVDTKCFKTSREKTNLYILEVDQIKDTIAELIKLTWKDETKDQPDGFMNYPIPEGGKYLLKSFFAHYESEHCIPKENANGDVIGMKWEKRGSHVQNHMWDCRIYNYALREIFAHLICKESKLKYTGWVDYVSLLKNSVDK